ncbi:MAG TPA: dTDP-4-dehydrorhamnose 3,5-epimerase family protein [bacterium]|nr:dTDP-4-dehydrorhamnose 3,5-epimerase family protein [Candidatus Omnitrophota bacterium]HOJ59481.1 dTDP-4-dehydrorhamnose 3,5-epimerase family protein [bacterium]HOL94768.1 dTDP-4-dehydrorhamnose 3,5-epimerase family protein [bacterium]HPP00611.1 dTDP-4-dehydrorhamnose 3,5-epimerase family protein [bacterium]HXK94813.1 dTDP-4-dehydrorhamnose 3,5-epimerase family protein [bacterium]
MIDGVKLIHRKRHCDDRGYLVEILRADDPEFIQFGQVYVSFLRRGVIKAWHKHDKQTDAFFVVAGTSKIGLYDDREGSPTKGAYQTVILGDEGEAALLMIPPGVWHGQMSLSEATYLVNLPTEPYNSKHPDEIRAPVEAFEDVWTIRNR